MRSCLINEGQCVLLKPTIISPAEISAGVANLSPWMSFDLGEFEFCVVWVHLSDLFSCWGSQHLKETKRLIYFDSTNAKIPNALYKYHKHEVKLE